MVVRPVAVSASRSARASDSWAWRTSRPRWCRVRTTLEVIIRLAPACSATSCWVGGPAVCSNQPTAPSTVNWVAVSPRGAGASQAQIARPGPPAAARTRPRAADRSPVASRSFRGAAGDLALERGPGLAHVAAHPRAEVEPELRDQWPGDPPRLGAPDPAGTGGLEDVLSGELAAGRSHSDAHRLCFPRRAAGEPVAASLRSAADGGCSSSGPGGSRARRCLRAASGWVTGHCRGKILAWPTPYGYRRHPRDTAGAARLTVF